MCIIVYLPIDKTIDKERFMQCASTNRDGFGMMYVVNNKLIKLHTLDKDRFYETYSRVSKDHGSKTPIAMHFRLSTGGKKDINNCHPFVITDNIAFMHNGILTQHKSTDDYCDTYIFCKEVLQGLDFDFMHNKTALYLIKKYIGFSNKMLFMNNLGEVEIINDVAGKWIDGIWYSSYVYGMDFYGRGSRSLVHHSQHIGDDICGICTAPLYSTQELADGLCYRCSSFYTDNKNCTEMISKADKLDIMCCTECNSIMDSSDFSVLHTPDESIYLCLDCLYSDKPIKDFLTYEQVVEGSNMNDEDDPSTISDTDVINPDLLSEEDWVKDARCGACRKLYTESGYKNGKKVMRYYIINKLEEKQEVTEEIYNQAAPANIIDIKKTIQSC